VDLAAAENLINNEENQDLCTLTRVIEAIAHNHTYIPYKESKLTRILKDSIGGESNTVLIGCINQDYNHVYETKKTIRFASRAKSIRNEKRLGSFFEGDSDDSDEDELSQSEDLTKVESSQTSERKTPYLDDAEDYLEESSGEEDKNLNVKILNNEEKLRSALDDVTLVQKQIQEMQLDDAENDIFKGFHDNEKKVLATKNYIQLLKSQVENKMNDVLSQYEKEILDLTYAIEENESKLLSLNEENDEKIDLITLEYKEKILQVEQEKNTIRKEKTRELESLYEKVAVQNLKMNELENEFEIKQNDEIAYKNMIDSLKLEMNSLTKFTNSLQDQLFDKDDQIKTLLLNFKVQMESKEMVLQDIEKCFQDKDAKIKELEETITKRQSDVVECVSDILTLSASVKELENKNKNLNEKINSLNKQNINQVIKERILKKSATKDDQSRKRIAIMKNGRYLIRKRIPRIESKISESKQIESIAVETDPFEFECKHEGVIMDLVTKITYMDLINSTNQEIIVELENQLQEEYQVYQANHKLNDSAIDLSSIV
jgi:hypothetical protein